jgi:hypothetical protein
VQIIINFNEVFIFFSVSMKKILKKLIVNNLIGSFISICLNLFVKFGKFFLVFNSNKNNNYKKNNNRNDDFVNRQLTNSTSCIFYSKNDEVFTSQNKIKIATSMFIVFVMCYISLNNYFIIFVYLKSSSSSSAYLSSKNTGAISYKSYKNAIDSRPLVFGKSLPNGYYFNEINSNHKHFIHSMQTNKQSNDKILIDLQDILVANLNLNNFLNDGKLIILNDSFFLRDQENESRRELADKINNSNKNSDAKSTESSSLIFNGKRHDERCVHPKLNPFDQNIMQFVKKEISLKCNPKQVQTKLLIK